MDDKIVLGIVALCLVLGGVAGYIFFQANFLQTQLNVITSEKLALQTQVASLKLQLIEKDQIIQSLNARTEPRLVVFETSKGIIEIELYQDKAPITVTNFIKYVEANFYDGTVFHRVVNMAFFRVVQGGGFTADGTQKSTNPPIKLESTGLKNLKGTIAMARSANPDSATSQFYFNVIDHTNLDPSSGNSGYVVFGKVVQGWEFVESIAGVATGTKTISGNEFRDWPIQDALIQRAYVKR